MVSGRRLLFAGFLGAFSGLFRVAVQLITLPIFAKVLGPHDFGLFALALPTISLLMLLADGGLGASMARENPDQTRIWSTAFWTMNAAGLLLAGGTALWSLWLGNVAHEPRLPPLMFALSLAFPLVSLSVLPTARLTRAGRLDVGAGIDICASGLGAAAGVAIALRGGGVWALAAQYLVSAASRAIAVNATAGFLPRFHFDLKLLRGHLAIGGSLIASRFCDYAGRLGENAMFARELSTSLLGSFSFANQTSRFAAEAVTGPAWGVLYYRAINQPMETVRPVYLLLVRGLSSVLAPAAALVTVGAPTLVTLVMGQAWRPSGLAMAILFPAMTFNAISTQGFPLCYALGRPRPPLLVQILLSGGRLAAVLCGFHFGLLGVTIGVAVSLVLTGVLGFATAARITGLRAAALLRAGGPASLCAAAAGVVGVVVLHALSAYPQIWTLTMALSAVAATYLLLILSLDLTGVQELLSSLREAIRQTPRGEAAIS